ncbi:ATP-binding protein [Galbibacter sp. EGI 63066]|uniref:AlbA family DNA-binding domain-containing protein n=1 Tax=Galbibacter sp. EGI 63066 TaxID=2993559 RepID=UPI002248DB62|nr:ATP-binding protein [Galbibacter sp. EGI 63066]MCX2681905.1 ATP-binding protein [Galbibacter sp. EGI 63066]
MEEWTLYKLQQLIEDQIEESNSLDYKGAGALAKSDGKKKEISKDVSAFANSNGGMIIYGIREFDNPDKNHLPEKIDPVQRNQISKEWLEQVIATRIQPKIEGLEIIPVTIDEIANTVVYVVQIPKSTTAHQASDNKYYKRYNFQSEAMQDYEIRDVMNRMSYPKIELEFKIESRYPADEFPPDQPDSRTRTSNTLKIYARNTGSVYANYVNYYVYFNKHFLESTETQNLRNFKEEGVDMVEYYGENTIRDVVGTKLFGMGATPEYGPSRFDPILPGMHSRPEILKLRENINGFHSSHISWKVYADNARPVEGKIQIKDIPVIYIKEDIQSNNI